MSVKETTDGRVLIHCFAGCDAAEVVGAVGLDISALFPPRESSGAPLKRRHLLGAAQALELLSDEALLVAVCAANIWRGIDLTDDDRARCLTAAARVAYLVDEVRA